MHAFISIIVKKGTLKNMRAIFISLFHTSSGSYYYCVNIQELSKFSNHFFVIKFIVNLLIF